VVRGRIDAIFRPPATAVPDAPEPTGDNHATEQPRTGAPRLEPVQAPRVELVGEPPQVEPVHEAPRVELVDWKTGRQVERAAGGLDQLGIYALALRELGQLPGDRCLVSYCYLDGDRPVIETRALGPADLDRQRALVEAALASLERGDYQRACGRPDCDTCGRGPAPRPPAARSRWWEPTGAGAPTEDRGR
jgi:PD-(D/E)XK nuclease superfamily